MRILFFSHYFPPEGNAPASRVHALCKRWVKHGHHVTVVTCAPNVPDGKIYEGYRNKLSQRETIDGIEVVRVWTYVAANAGTVKRIANYVSYTISATLRSLALPRPDVVIATSPQFFCGWAGVWVKRLKRAPLILEIRDIWPESIVAVGAMRESRLIRFLEWLEHRMYAAASHIVTVGEGYRQQLLGKGIGEHAITVIPNGVDSDLFTPRAPDEQLKAQHGLADKFVCSYIGTIGMACGLEVVLEAGRKLKAQGRNDVAFLLVGDGAVRAQLQGQAEAEGLDNVVFVGRQDRSLMPNFLSISDCCLVHLRGAELFKTVLPSKIFEAAAMARPIVLGLEGEAKKLIETSGGGVCVTPENADQLVQAVSQLADDPIHRKALGDAGRHYITTHYDRGTLASQYMAVLEQCAANSGASVVVKAER